MLNKMPFLISFSKKYCRFTRILTHFIVKHLIYWYKMFIDIHFICRTVNNYEIFSFRLYQLTVIELMYYPVHIPFLEIINCE